MQVGITMRKLVATQKGSHMSSKINIHFYEGEVPMDIVENLMVEGHFCFVQDYTGKDPVIDSVPRSLIKAIEHKAFHRSAVFDLKLLGLIQSLGWVLKAPYDYVVRGSEQPIDYHIFVGGGKNISYSCIASIFGLPFADKINIESDFTLDVDLRYNYDRKEWNTSGKPPKSIVHPMINNPNKFNPWLDKKSPKSQKTRDNI